MKLISTESLNRWVDNWLAKNKYYHPYSNSNSIPISELKDILELMPAVEAEPVRHAHWVWKGDEGDSRFMCSECGGMEHVPTCMGIPNIWEYCPNCGSRMEEYELARKRADTETD